MQNWGGLVRPPLHGWEVGLGGGSLFSSNMGPDQQGMKNKGQLPDRVCIETRVLEILPEGLVKGQGNGHRAWDGVAVGRCHFSYHPGEDGSAWMRPQGSGREEVIPKHLGK